MTSLYYTHINRNTINSNRKQGTSEPAVRFQKGKYGKATYCHRAKFEAGEIMYKPSGEPILPCGARLVIITKEQPIVIE
jgi:hypothetical protein